MKLFLTLYTQQGKEPTQQDVKYSSRSADEGKGKIEPGSSVKMPSTSYAAPAGGGAGGSQSTPQVFTDEELSEIFQIDFASIFGSPDANLKNSNYKGVQLPNQKTGALAPTPKQGPLLTGVWCACRLFQLSIGLQITRTNLPKLTESCLCSPQCTLINTFITSFPTGLKTLPWRFRGISSDRKNFLRHHRKIFDWI